MSIAIGGNSVSKMYVGSTEITKAYIGDTLVYGGQQPTPSGYYYIYRTSSNIIERRDIAQYPTVNFPAIAGNSYGGVFTDYGGKGTVATALANGDPVTFVDDRVQDDGSGYIGESNVSGAAKMFNVSDAIITGTTAYTPTVGTIYYVKEVPDWILLRYFTYGYSKTSPKHLTCFYAVTGLDSLAYNSIVCRFKEESQSTFDTINLTAHSSYTPTGTSASINANKVFQSKGLFNTNTGYVCGSADILSRLEVGKTYIAYFEATTPDGIVIHSPIKYELVIDSLNLGGFHIAEIQFEPFTYDAQVEYIETSSDNCNINIRVIAKGGYKFEIDAYIPPSSDAGYLFGCKAADDTYMYLFTPNDDNGQSVYKYYNTTSNTSTSLEGRYTFSNLAKVNECVVTNGTDTITYTCSYTSSVSAKRLIYVLGLNENGGARKTIKGIRLYSMKIYSGTNNTLQADLIPVRKDGRGYLYDKEDGTQLLAPKGDPITVYGADVVENE